MFARLREAFRTPVYELRFQPRAYPSVHHPGYWEWDVLGTRWRDGRQVEWCYHFWEHRSEGGTCRTREQALAKARLQLEAIEAKRARGEFVRCPRG